MVGFVHSLHMQSDLNPKKKVYPFSGDGGGTTKTQVTLDVQKQLITEINQ